MTLGLLLLTVSLLAAATTVVFISLDASRFIWVSGRLHVAGAVHGVWWFVIYAAACVAFVTLEWFAHSPVVQALLSTKLFN